MQRWSKVGAIGLALALVLALPSPGHAQFTFITNNGAITIIGYTGSGGVISIPSSLTGRPVTCIDDWAFYATSVTDVLISDSITNIGDGAFFDCESLTNITVGKNTKDIGNWTFAFCSNLTSINFRGNTPSLVGNEVFFGNLATLYYLPGTTNWGATFVGRPTVLWSPPLPFAYTVNTDSITITGYTCSNGIVIIPTLIDFLPVTTIGESAFESCFGLTTVTISDGVTNIRDRAFYSCTSLTNVTMGKSVTSIGDAVFQNCSSLTNISLPNSIANIAGSFTHSGLTSIVIPNSVTNLSGWTFSYCPNLTSVTLGNGISIIGYGMFYNCPNLSTVTIGNSVTHIQQSSFWATGLTNLDIPNNVTRIEALTFASTRLTNVTIGTGLTDIGNTFDQGAPFHACPNLVTIAVDAGNPAYCSVAGVLFNKNRDKLIEYPRGLTGKYTIPSSVTSIGDFAFYYCTSLTGIYFEGSAPSLGASVFAGVNAATAYYLPGTMGWGATLGGLPVAPWLRPNPVILNNSPTFGVLNGNFGFNISWATNISFVVEACTNLATPNWQPLQTNTLTTGSAYFSDPQWTNFSERFYRIRSP